MNRFVFLGACLLVACACCLTSSAALVTVADYTFEDASSLAPFTQTGTPTVSGGQLQLDGSSFLEIADPLGGATDNFVVEAIMTAAAFDSFDFGFARNDPAGANGGNNGQGLLIQDFGSGPGQTKVLNSFSGATGGFGPDPDPFLMPIGTAVAVAAVQNGGVTEIYVNGVQLANPASSSTIVGVPTNLGIGTHPFDGVAGAFNGSIARVRLSTFSQGEFMAGQLLAVPEPSTIALSCMAVVGMLTFYRQRTV